MIMCRGVGFLLSLVTKEGIACSGIMVISSIRYVWHFWLICISFDVVWIPFVKPKKLKLNCHRNFVF